MAFKSQSDEQEAISDINVTPLVDVMLVLVIILLVTAPLLTQSVKVNLPKTATTEPDIKEAPLQLSVDAAGQIMLNKRVVPTMEALDGWLRDEHTRNPEVSLHLYADKAVNYGKVAEVLAATQHVGITKIGFVTVAE